MVHHLYHQDFFICLGINTFDIIYIYNYLFIFGMLYVSIYIHDILICLADSKCHIIPFKKSTLLRIIFAAQLNAQSQ